MHTPRPSPSSPSLALPVALLLALVVALPNGAVAQTDTLPSPADLSPPVDLPAATVRADQLPRPLLATPAAVTRITPRELTARDLALTPADALSRVPGVTMQTGGLGTSRIVIRGQGARAPFTTNRVRAYLGAIPLTDGEGGTDLEDVDLALLSSVDVVRGPAATTYGSGLGGVILLEPDFAIAPGSVQPHAEALAGRFGTYRAGAGVGLASADGGAVLRVGYRRTQSDGFRENSRYRRDNLTALVRFRESGTGGSGFRGSGAPANHTDLQLLWTGVRNEIPSSLGATALAEDPTQAGGTWGASRGYEAYDRIGFGVSHARRLAARWRLEGSAFARTRRAYEPRPFNVLRENTFATGGRALLGYRGAGGVLRASVGGELFRDWYDWGTYVNRYRDFPPGTGSVRGATLSDQAEVRTQGNAFAQADLALGALLGLRDPTALTLTGGLGVNRTRYRLADYFAADSLDQSGDYGFGAQVSPRLALRYAVRPDWSAYAQVARGFSPPSVAETLTPEGRVNPDIAPETGWNHEVGLRGIDPDGRWTFDAVAYLLRANDLLVARRTAEDAFVGINAGRTRHLGVELAGDYTLGAARAGAGFGASLFGSYTLQAHRFVEFVDGDDDYAGKALTGVPRHQGAVGFDWWAGRGVGDAVDPVTASRWSGYLGLRGLGRLPVNDANTVYADGYATVGARVTRAFGLGAQRLAFTAGVDNLFDADYVSMVSVNAGGFGGSEPRYFYPGWPRTWWVGVRWGLGDSNH